MPAQKTPMPSAQTIERFIARAEQNAHVEGIQEFYADDATMQENQDPPRVGKAVLLAAEQKVMARAASVKTQCVRPVLVQGDVVVIRWIFDFVWKDGSHTHIEELAYQRWRDELIVEEQFFYDPVQFKPSLPTASDPQNK
jgi:ketosteroid isomerase-like protein